MNNVFFLLWVLLFCGIHQHDGAPDMAAVRDALQEGQRLDNSAVEVMERQGSAVEGEDLVVRFDNYLEILRTLVNAFNDADLETIEMQDLHRELRGVNVRLSQRRKRLRDMLRAEQDRYRAPTTRTGRPGRPKVNVTEEQLVMFYRFGFTGVAVARMLGVSIRTVRRRMEEFGIMKREFYTEMTDEELDELVAEIKRTLPGAAGTGTVLGHLRARDISLANGHRRVYESLVRLDSLATTRRWNPTTRRRTYWVPAPGSLWHIDGNHKLIRWGIVIHGGIDGYSRLITFCQASDNNYAQTVGLLFINAAREVGLPSRIRTDRGGENVIAGAVMDAIRGEGRGSWLRGPSVHNQRIERLWRDLRTLCTNFFIDLFYGIEQLGILSPYSSINLFALHYVFLPRLNLAINDFRLAYNNHGLRTMHNQTPWQIFVSGIMGRFNSNYLQVRELIDNTQPDVNPEEFGIQGNVDGEDEGEQVINVPRPSLGLNDEQYQQLLQGLRQELPDVTQDCDDNGVQFYLLASVFIHSFITNTNN